MVYRRSRRTRRFRPKRTFRRKAIRRMPRRMPSLRSGIIRVRETFKANGGTGYNLNNGEAGIVSLDMINAGNLAGYQALYQNYKITGASFLFISNFVNGELNQAGENIAISAKYSGISRIVWVENKRGAAAPSSELDALSHQNRKIRVVGTKGTKFYVKNPQFMQLTGATSAEYTYKTGICDLANSDDLPHYCAQWWMSGANTGNGGNNPYDVYVTLYVTFYNPK